MTGAISVNEIGENDQDGPPTNETRTDDVLRAQTGNMEKDWDVVY